MAHEYTRKPLIVTAIQWTGDNFDEVRELVAPARDTLSHFGGVLAIGDHLINYAFPGWWIIKNGDTFRTMSNRDFRGHFERVGGGDDQV